MKKYRRQPAKTMRAVPGVVPASVSGSVAGSLTVLFNPSEAHVQNLLRLRRLCHVLVAVDNSQVADLRLHERLRSEGIDLLSNLNKGGVAGAYNKGLDRLVEKGCQLLFIFDQDSVAPEDYFVQMRTLASP